MKFFFLYEDLESSGAVWLNSVWPLLSAIRASVPTECVITPRAHAATGVKRFDFLRQQAQVKAHSRRLCRQVSDGLSRTGPNVLLVHAVAGKDMTWAKALFPVWSHFDKTVLLVNDTIQAKAANRSIAEKFDCIVSLCADIAKDFEDEIGVPTVFWPGHSDVLRTYSVQEYRPIDLLLIGRRDLDPHLVLHKHFNRADSDRLYVDFVTRTQTPGTPEEEFRLLMNTHARSQAAFCYEASNVARFKGRSPLMGRWVHAWAAGCTIFGTRPTGLGVAERIDWHESILELPTEATDAIQYVESVLSDAEGMASRRRRNVYQALARHDTRYRIRDLLDHLGVEHPQSLRFGLEKLEQACASLDEPIEISRPKEVRSVRYRHQIRPKTRPVSTNPQQAPFHR